MSLIGLLVISKGKMCEAEAEPWQRAGRMFISEGRSKLATWVTDQDFP